MLERFPKITGSKPFTFGISVSDKGSAYNAADLRDHSMRKISKGFDVANFDVDFGQYHKVSLPPDSSRIEGVIKYRKGRSTELTPTIH